MSEARHEIVVGVDGSPAGDAALVWALVHAAVAGDRVVAVHAWQVPTFVGPGHAYVSLVDEQQLQDAARARLDEALARAAARAGKGGDPAVTAVTVQGTAAQVLESRARDAAMLVLGRGKVARLGQA